MKALKLVPYLVLVSLISVGVYLLIGITNQEKLQSYSDFIETSSGKVLEGINKQSEQINRIGNISDIEEGVITDNEDISSKFKTLLEAEKKAWQELKKPEGSKETQKQMEEFFKGAEESNKQFDEAMMEIKILKKEDELLSTIKGYNEKVTKFAETYEELIENLNNYIDESNFIR
ncbi:hypothetical protein JW796_03070 [Candidatus Dojkabacteria bacterium]|nr:hypothetical protein [Candidatus Dojkabacteria bacterium]